MLLSLGPQREIVASEIKEEQAPIAFTKERWDSRKTLEASHPRKKNDGIIERS